MGKRNGRFPVVTPERIRDGLPRPFSCYVVDSGGERIGGRVDSEMWSGGPPVEGWWLRGGFFVGTDRISQVRYLTHACISVNSLRRRKSLFSSNHWILDSGAFTELTTHGRYRYSVSEYISQIRKWNQCYGLLAAVSQDYMCEPFVLEKTGLTKREHQDLTIQRYDCLLLSKLPVYLMPVLQGYEPGEYVSHLISYGERLKLGMWVGVGSVCKRNGTPDSVFGVLSAIAAIRPDLRLHGFGLKTTALAESRILRLLYSADSMAWSYAARYAGRDRHGLAETLEFQRKIVDTVSLLYARDHSNEKKR